MTDIEILDNYRECHVMAQELGMKLEIVHDNFRLYKGEEELIRKMKLTTILAYLQGYKEAISNS